MVGIQEAVLTCIFQLASSFDNPLKLRIGLIANLGLNSQVKFCMTINDTLARIEIPTTPLGDLLAVLW